MKKQDLFANMFAAAIDWKKVDENTAAIAAILDKEAGNND